MILTLAFTAKKNLRQFALPDYLPRVDIGWLLPYGWRIVLFPRMLQLL